MTSKAGQAAEQLVWDGEIQGPEIRFAPAANNPGELVPMTNSYYWSEVEIGNAKRKFYLNVGGLTLQMFRQSVGAEWENVLRDCLRNHVRELIENHGWVPVPNDERRVSDEELSEKLKYVRPKN